MGELSNLPNIGKTVEEQLFRVGINSALELKRIGAKEAWLKIQEIDESACIHRLMALEGAIQGVKKTILSDEVKADLKEFYKRNKRYINRNLLSYSSLDTGGHLPTVRPNNLLGGTYYVQFCLANSIGRII